MHREVQSSQQYRVLQLYLHISYRVVHSFTERYREVQRGTEWSAIQSGAAVSPYLIQSGHLNRLVQRGTEWYREVQRGTEWYSCISISHTEWSPKQIGTDWYREVQNGTERYRVVQRGTAVSPYLIHLNKQLENIYVRNTVFCLSSTHPSPPPFLVLLFILGQVK